MTEADHTTFLATMLELAETLQTILDAVAGYRHKCEEAGFSPTAAEQMAVDLHRSVMSMAFTTPGSK